MKKITTIVLLILSINCGFTQLNPQWKGYFSYNNIKDLSASTTTLFAAAENALFFKNNTSSAISTINSVDGFKPDEISSIYYSEQKKIIFVGNTNGLLLLILSDGRVLQKRGIIDEVPVSPLIKKINSFYEYETKVYLSCDYGISVFDLNTMEFGDTFAIGNGGQYGKVFQTTVFNNEIYAVTQNSGIKKAAVSNPNLVDFNQWAVFDSGFYSGIVTFANQLIVSNNNLLLKHNGTQFVFLLSQPQSFNKIRVNASKLIAQSANRVFVVNDSLQLQAQIQSALVTELNVTFTCADAVDNVIYVGTNNSGVIAFSLANLSTYEILKPNGPEQNNIFRLKKSSSVLWALYGRYNRTYNPYNPPFGLGQFPISKYTAETGWTLIPYADLLGAKSLSNIAFSPNNDNELYVSSYYSGLLKIVDEVPVTIYNASNTGVNGLQTIPGQVPDDIRVNGPAFDKNGNLWMTNNMVSRPLKVFKGGNQWQSYDFTEVIPETESESYASLVVDKNNTKWIPTARNGVVGFNEELSNKSIVIKSGTEGNLPDTDIRCLAIDNRNQLWIGTGRGLRVVQNVDQFLSQDEIQTRAIIILENDLAQELFYEQFILDIYVDGANRKWVSIADSGVYLVSANGQETIYHFTKEDSPLPSNNVNDIEIDAATGEVFFATDKGLVSFQGSATKPSEDLSNVFVYPNPVRPEYDGTVKISGLTDKANVKVTDVAGNLVYESTALGGTIEWDTTAFGKYKVASGVYMIFIAAEDGIETKVKKVMIIR